MDPALTELIKSGIIGTFLVVVIVGSMTGQIRWGGQVDALIETLKENLAQVRADKNEAVLGWRAQTDATNKVAAALEQTNAILLEREHRRRGAG